MTPELLIPAADVAEAPGTSIFLKVILAVESPAELAGGTAAGWLNEMAEVRIKATKILPLKILKCIYLFSTMILESIDII